MLRTAYSIAAWSNAKRADAFIHNSDGRMERPVRREITLPGRGVKFADDLRCAVRAAADALNAVASLRDYRSARRRRANTRLAIRSADVYAAICTTPPNRRSPVARFVIIFTFCFYFQLRIMRTGFLKRLKTSIVASDGSAGVGRQY